MVEVEKYIKRLLYDQNCVIIPDFGGVLTHYLPARFDPVSGHYLPSERKVAFNEVLKVDDGLLAKFISENEGMSYEQAHQHIRDFVQTVQGLIRKNKTIVLNGVGTFQLSPEGRLVFQPDPGRNFHSDFYGLPAVPATDLRLRNTTEVPIDEAKPAGIVPLENTRDTPSRRIAWGNWISAASIACILVYVSAVLSQEPGATSSLNPIETVRTLFVAKTPEKVNPEPVEAAVKTGFGSPAYAAAERLPEAAESEETAVAFPVENTEAALPAATTNRFFIIASVYESQGSLDKYGVQMADRLRSAGFESIEILPVRDKYMLSAGAFDTWQEARKAIPGLNKTVKGAWIYKQK